MIRRGRKEVCVLSLNDLALQKVPDGAKAPLLRLARQHASLPLQHRAALQSYSQYTMCAGQLRTAQRQEAQAVVTAGP